MATKDISENKDKIIAEFGEWTAHNIHICGDIYTISEAIAGDEIKLRRIIQSISDVTCKPFDELRILDLACLEGMYGIECARHGADVVALDIREANIRKTEFVKQALRLDNLSVVCDDVRNISADKYGKFDVVLCLGILYHLDTEDVFGLVEKIAGVTKSVAIFDTQISLKSSKPYVHNNAKYYGRRHIEHRKKASGDEKKMGTWLSIDNPMSFWLTKPSLLNLLSNSGFSTVIECHVPAEEDKPANRITLIACRGSKKEIISSPKVNELPAGMMKEKGFFDSYRFYKMLITNSVKFHLSLYLPEWIKRIIRE